MQFEQAFTRWPLTANVCRLTCCLRLEAILEWLRVTLFIAPRPQTVHTRAIEKIESVDSRPRISYSRLKRKPMPNFDIAFQQPIVFVLTFLALVLSIGVHEFAHVLSAYLQGDQTGRLLGRLTLNPIKHLDPYGTVFILLSMLSGFGIGWGKPAPFNPNSLRYRRWGEFFVAIAGPISNIILVALFGYTLLAIGPNLPEGNLLLVFLQALVLINAGLAVFNLLPIPPLDGSRILGAVLGEMNPLVVTLNRYGFILLLFLIVFARPLLGTWVTGGIRLILGGLGLI